MEIIEYTPDKSVRYIFPWKPLYILPFGDLQLGSEACDENLAKKVIEEALEKDALFIGMGDYVDVASPSNRREWNVMKKYDSFQEAMDAKSAEYEDRVYELLKPTKGRWLGMLTGHHWWEYDDGSTTDTNLCRRLGAPHLGHCGMVHLKFARNPEKGEGSVMYKIWAHHGVGGGAQVAAPLNRLEKVMQWVEADLYLMGHQHKRVSAPVPRFYTTDSKNPILVAREKRLLATGSYLKGYMQGSRNRAGRARGTYVEERMLAPVALGSPLVKLIPTDRKIKGVSVRDVITKVED